jgi:nitrate/nitrite transport system permease protein
MKETSITMTTAQRVTHGLNLAGLSVLVPIARLCAGDEPGKQLELIARHILVPIVVFALFIGAWALSAPKIETPYGQLPTPVAVWRQAGMLFNAYFANAAAKAEFAAKQNARARQHTLEAEGFARQATAATDLEQRAALRARADTYRQRAQRALEAKFSASPTYLDQIFTSLKTVFAGFLIASMVAIPVGILCGLSATFMSATAPFIAIFKPVSPLAWLPIVMIIISAVYTTDPSVAWFEKAFLSSAVTVALCSLWPTLVNTAHAVGSIDKDHLNVARVLRLGTRERITKIILPASLSLIFTGLRLSLGVGWMVLIAAEMLAQNPGLGKFVWDMFQNGSSETLAAIIVAVFTIGLIGFVLDRIMVVLQKLVSFEAAPAA